MSNVFANRVFVTTATVGTGTLTLGAALGGYRGFGAAGIANGATVRYLIVDGSDWEIGTGVHSTSGPTMTRATVEASSWGGNRVSLTGAARVSVIASAADYANFVRKTDSSTGSNADGTFWREASGLQICQRVVPIGTGAGQFDHTAQNVRQRFDYPAPFAAGPPVTVSGSISGSGTSSEWARLADMVFMGGGGDWSVVQRGSHTQGSQPILLTAIGTRP